MHLGVLIHPLLIELIVRMSVLLHDFCSYNCYIVIIEAPFCELNWNNMRIIDTYLIITVIL